MEIDAKMVAQLRAETGAPMMDCKAALQETKGDKDKAKDVLRKKGKQIADKAATREVKEGKLFGYQHFNGKIAVIAEIVCETDFVAKNEEFNAFGKGVCFTIAASSPPLTFVNREQVDKALAAWISGLGLSPLGFLLMVNVLFLLLGALLDATTLLLVLVPVLLPTVAALGIDPVYFGVVIIFNITIGLTIPPHGLLLFVLSALTRIPLREIFRESWGLVAALVACLFTLVAFPGIVMWLPRLLGYVK